MSNEVVESSQLASNLLANTPTLSFPSNPVVTEVKHVPRPEINIIRHQPNKLVSNGEDNQGTSKSTRKTTNKRNCEYKKYDDHQISEYINLITEGMSVKEAAKKLNITINTAYRYRKMWNTGGVTPVRNKRGPAEGAMSKLKEEHTKFIINYIDNEKKDGALIHIRDALRREFPDLEVSSSALHRHMKAKCAISLKRLHTPPESRNDADLLAAIETWLASKDMDFEKNCVFVGEASYSMHTSRHHGWKNRTKNGEAVIAPPPVPTNSMGGVSIFILGAISAKGVINVSTRKATTVTTTTTQGERRHPDGTLMDSFENDQFFMYLMTVLDILDKHGLNGFYLLMDDASVKEPVSVKRRIEERGYKCAFLPTVLPFPNPIEKFWSKTVGGIDRSPLVNAEISSRIAQACLKVTPNDCCEWIRQSIPYSPLRLSSGGRGTTS
ncbi:uncharacterized protein B0P05DRAFT_524806 [Gilbertella persicaria]|uniref:Tc1-like transposase DDE domain-containing protein n=1 Tax=Rhizopus stolonifer TaxID=4846 RepID=A0A367JLS1_RHIST|nr:uncharacterized protein B0P05DRAFT_524806 [Gilbertella persicaria]KAI8095124.1 hypothetical protein B0P05DRAFT_524806 [Gilbertella persicaria]RCH90894.1 hypothetical protein CU098_003915 [Rhizopus stolonifer]